MHIYDIIFIMYVRVEFFFKINKLRITTCSKICLAMACPKFLFYVEQY